MTAFKVVGDTNIFLSAFLSPNSSSPSKEFVRRWRNREFELLFTDDILSEYRRKLLEKGFSEDVVRDFLALILRVGQSVEIKFYHLKKYPVDYDDICFLLCALNGNASHLLTYDQHLLTLKRDYQGVVNITKLIPFLEKLR